MSNARPYVPIRHRCFCAFHKLRRSFDYFFRSYSHFLTTIQTSYQCFHHLEPRSKWPVLALLLVVPALLSIPISYHVSRPTFSLLLALLTHGSAVTLFTLMYRLSPSHPLAKYPGPAIAKTSKLWAAYVCSRGNLHRYFKSLHERYGDVVRIGGYQSHPLHVCGVAQLV